MHILTNAHSDCPCAADLTHSTDFFSRDVAAERMKELTGWIKEKGVRDFEKVPLFSEQLDKVRL